MSIKYCTYGSQSCSLILLTCKLSKFFYTVSASLAVRKLQPLEVSSDSRLDKFCFRQGHLVKRTSRIKGFCLLQSKPLKDVLKNREINPLHHSGCEIPAVKALFSNAVLIILTN